MRTVDDIMALWPNVSEFARDIGIKPTHAHVMKVRGRIAVEHWPAIVRAAKRRGFDSVTADVLLKIDALAQSEVA